MSENENILEEFKKAIDDLYEQGYICGFGSDRDKWLDVYAKAMVEISKGADFNDNLIFACDDSLPTNMNALN